MGIFDNLFGRGDSGKTTQQQSNHNQNDYDSKGQNSVTTQQNRKPVQMPIDVTPKPVSEAVLDETRGVWVQDYQVWDGTNWVIKRFKHDGVNWVDDTVEKQKIDLTKRIPQTTAGINLKKSVVSLDKSLVDLTKKSGINLTKHSARVAVLMDYSGSMSKLYINGSVQKVLNRLMPLALRFDDNGELDVWLFENSYRRFDGMTLDNFDTYVNDVIMSSSYKMGGTEYAPVISDMLHKYFVEERMNNTPTFVIFITDGDNFDKKETDKMIIKSAKENVFIQFVGIGQAAFSYLERLDDLSGRVCDNTGFIKVADFNKLSDEELYDMLLNQYPDWLKVKGLR